jgi:hypothetical protein
MLHSLDTSLLTTGVYIMSIISTSHTVTSYQSGKTKPLEGQRLAKVTYKTDKVTGVKPDSKAVSIPLITWTEITPYIKALQGEFVDVVHKAQDALVRRKVEAGAASIHEDDISMSAVVSYLVEESGRMTGEVIREWYKESLSDSLMIAFASKLGIPEDSAGTTEQQAKLEKILKGYEDSFAKLASGKASFNDMQRTNMLKALELIEDGDALKDKFVVRLSKVSNDDDLLMAL